MDDFLTFGWGKYGQLGHGDEYNVFVPKTVDRSQLHGNSLISLSCGFNFNVAVTSKGDVYTWGLGKHGTLAQADNRNYSVPRRVKELQKLGIFSVAAGNEHSLALTKDGNVYSWGCGCYGMLGRGGENDDFKPQTIPLFGPESLNTIIVKQISCGFKHSLALDDQARVYSWGFGGNGRLGHGSDDNCLTPKLIKALDATAREETVVEEKGDASKSLDTFSDNVEEEIPPYEEKKFGKIKEISCGWNHSCVLSAKGYVFTFGLSKDGALGHGEDGYDVLVPERITHWVQASKKRGKGNSEELDKVNVKSISCGGKHNLALTQDGEVYSWGRGELGRLGHGDEEVRYYPTVIETLTGKQVTAVSGGGYHSVVLTEPGHVYTFGFGEYGRLGHNDGKNVLIPQRIEALSDRKVNKIFSGAYQTALNAEAQDGKGKSRCLIL